MPNHSIVKQKEIKYKDKNHKSSQGKMIDYFKRKKKHKELRSQQQWNVLK